MNTLFQDLKFGLRMLAKNPGFTAVAVLTLALGIGATTAIFTVVNAVLLRPLPYPHPEELVYVQETLQSYGVQPFVWNNEFVAWRNQSHTGARQQSGSFQNTEILACSYGVYSRKMEA